MNWRRLLHPKKAEGELEKELAFHLEQHAADLEARGHSPAEARRLARIELGGPAQVKEDCRDAAGTRWAEDFVHDVRYAVRTLRQRPGFAAVALVSLALGTGATTIMYSVIDGVLLKPFAYRGAGRLLRLWERTDYQTASGNIWAYTYPDYLDCKQAAPALDTAVWYFHQGTLAAPGPAEYEDGLYASPDLFPLLGVNAALGRTFLPDENRPVALISDRLWRRRFGGSPAALGAHLTFYGQPYTVVGVLPADFRLEDDRFDVITPIGQMDRTILARRRSHGFHVWARLRPGATMAQAQMELSAVARRLAQAYPDSNKGRTFYAEYLKPDVGDAKSTMLLLLGAVTLVLLIACANIASLLVARAVSRERELAMRVALGASRGRLARQCLTESGVLAFAGGALGVALAAMGMAPFARFWPGGLPRVQEVELNWRVMLFALGLALASGLLFGLAPALRAPTRHLEQTLRSGSRTLAGGAHRLHGVFVASEIALAVVLLVSAGLLGRTLLRLSALDPGIDIHNVLVARTALSPATLADSERTRVAWKALLDEARRVPGVQAAALIDTVPMREGSNAINYSVVAANVDDGREYPTVLANCATPEYFQVAGTALRRGRLFTEDDRKGTQSVAVIDEVMARQAFPGQDPIGKQIWLGIAPDPVVVVGVVRHVRQWGLAADDQSKLRAQLYYPFAQVPDGLVHRWSDLMSIVVRTSAPPTSLVEPLRQAIRGLTGDQVLYEINTFEQLATASLARQRFLLLLFGVFAVLALLLASIGIYGVLAYLTSRRIPEIGMRMALGASAPAVMWMVLRQSLEMVAVGIALGSGGAWLASRELVRVVDGVRGIEPATFGVMILVLLAAAMLASFLPARRASRIDPTIALRQE